MTESTTGFASATRNGSGFEQVSPLPYNTTVLATLYCIVFVVGFMGNVLVIYIMKKVVRMFSNF